MSQNIENFNSFLESNLNETQLKAVKQKDGALLVIAGAGSGKTRVITTRIANLIINENVKADSIVAMTFTNKAAQEMKERVHSWVQNKSEIPYIGTFHSFCLRILKANGKLIQLPEFTMLDDDDQQKILHGIIKRYSTNKKLNAKQILYNISAIKNNMILEHNQTGVTFAENKVIQDIYLMYEAEKKASKCLDFDDLIIETVKLFRKNSEFKKQFQQKYKHILVDEYQDTSMVQHELLKQMAQDENKKLAPLSLCAVGDEDQSIYSWRGANVENIINFNKDFPNTKIIKIEQNYRSAQPILETANHIINYNKNRKPKKLWSDKEAKNRLLHVSCASEYKEGDMIANAAQVASKAKPKHSFAVLYRTHYQSRAIEEALIKSSLPYTIIGGIQFYERKEIKDILAYLRLIINPFDRVSFFRVINCPTRGLGEKFEEDFYKFWSDEPFLDFKGISQKLIEEKALTKSKEESVNRFIKICDFNKDATISQAITHIINQTNYTQYLKEAFEKQEAETKIDNIKELLRAASHFESQGTRSIQQFLDEVALMQQKKTESEQEEKNNIMLMSLHAAKGLEFDIVAIAGLEEGIFPSSRSMLQDEEIEEERRLLYVGITRAKEYLIFSNVKYRNSFGQTNAQMPSRFLDEIPMKLIQQEDSSLYFSNQQFTNLFGQFFGNTTIKSNVMTFGSKVVPAKREVIKPKETETVSPWKKNHPVKHVQFGIGLIQNIENKADGKIVITARFNTGVKKIDSSFLVRI